MLDNNYVKLKWLKYKWKYVYNYHSLFIKIYLDKFKIFELFRHSNNYINKIMTNSFYFDRKI